MWRSFVLATIFICLIFSTSVKGSCLEYGHSCWGAHGKRSSGPAIASGKAQRQLNALDEDNSNRFGTNKFDFDETLTSAEFSPHIPASAEDLPIELNDSTKLRKNNNIEQRHLRFPLQLGTTDNNNSPPMEKGNRQSEPIDSPEQRQHSLQIQQQRKYPQHIERWHKFPLLGLRRIFGKSPLALSDAAAAAALELSTRNTENDLLQQLAGGRFDDVGVYYDFQ
ncbi:uncharacterized protein LOC105665375 [Ceratitis capitata]|uniref:uncharacterized protein LOC105665375 n=1 Tax=Ceratitis capitata TaxID=7213 RepID=UPI000618930B|nr:uncharacterized protein LOC105665375 [Ceratitis capitata]